MLLIPIQTQVVFTRWPWINFIWIGLCVFCYGVFNLAGEGREVFQWMVLDGWNPVGMIGHQFLHADAFHLLGNMIFLWVFGNAVNERFGQWQYVLFLLGGAVMSAITHEVFTGEPAIGASGVVNAVVGAYLVLYPLNRVSMFWFFFMKGGTFDLSGYILIVFWFIQDVWGAIAGADHGIAYWAHLGGFFYGVALMSWLVHSGRISLMSYDNPHLLDCLRPRKKPVRNGGIQFDEPPIPKPIQFSCPECGKEMSVAETRLGQEVLCDRCRTPILLLEE